MDQTPEMAENQAILYVLAAPQPASGAPAYLVYKVGGVGCVLAYTDLDRLVECCGEHQPWLGIKIGALMADLRDQRLPGPVVNLPLAPAIRWTAGGPPWPVPKAVIASGAAAGGPGVWERLL
jgi:hypothetical protein